MHHNITREEKCKKNSAKFFLPMTSNGVKYIVAFLTSITVLFPAVASADQISDMRAQIQVLQQLLAQLRGQTGTGPTVCTPLSGPVAPGSSGPNVSALQRFLARDPAIYPEAKVTGYYGSLTTTAVQRFQAKYNIVNSGSPSTTGYGKVGPKTLEVINSLCGIPSDNVAAFMQVSPDEGDAPLQVNVQVTVNTLGSCAAATYKVDFGDQTQPVEIQVPAGTCQPLQKTYVHTYTQPAVYEVVLSSGGHSSQSQVVVQP